MYVYYLTHIVSTARCDLPSWRDARRNDCCPEGNERGAEEGIGRTEALEGDLEQAYVGTPPDSDRRVSDPSIVLLSSLNIVKADAASVADTISECLEGTRKEILATIVDWAMDKDAKKIYLVLGLAGVGKSTICRTICIRLGHGVGASFFISRAVKERTDLVNLIDTLAYQLACSNEIVSERILATLGEKKGDVLWTAPLRFKELIVDPLTALMQSGTDPEPLLMVIDAVDEFANPVQFLDLIQQIPLNLPLKLLITSRNEGDILNKFNSIKHLPYVLHDADSFTVQSDIHQYLIHSFHMIREKYKLSSDWPSASDVDILLQRAGQLFVYAATITRFIAEDSPKESLASIVKGDHAAHDSASPYIMLDIVYLNVLMKACDPGLYRRALGRAKRRHSLLATIVLLQYPLSPDSLAKFLNKEDLNTMQNDLHSFASVLHIHQDAVQRFHPSFPDFITNRQRYEAATENQSLVFDVLIDPPSHHTQIASICLSHLQKLKQNICGLEKFQLHEDVENLREVVDMNIPAELKYACLH